MTEIKVQIEAFGQTYSTTHKFTDHIAGLLGREEMIELATKSLVEKVKNEIKPIK